MRRVKVMIHVVRIAVGVLPIQNVGTALVSLERIRPTAVLTAEAVPHLLSVAIARVSLERIV